jgi:hypothetical protein
VLGNASHDCIAHGAFDHNDSLRSREFIISWLNHTPHATACVRLVFGVTAASRNTRFQATCQALLGPHLHRLIAPALLGAFHHSITSSVR